VPFFGLFSVDYAICACALNFLFARPPLITAKHRCCGLFGMHQFIISLKVALTIYEIFELFHDNSKIKTFCVRIIVKQLSFFVRKISQIGKSTFRPIDLYCYILVHCGRPVYTHFS